MSGVNAHILLEAVHEASKECTGGGMCPLQRRRHWVLAPAHFLVGRAWPGATLRQTWCNFITDLSSPGLSYMHDHQVGPLLASRQAG